MKTITVSAEALSLLLDALLGPPHYIRELQVTMDNGRGLFKDNPIDILIAEWNEACKKHNEKEEIHPDVVTLTTFQGMCESSLPPDVFEMWEEVKRVLVETRVGLTQLRGSKNET